MISRSEATPNRWLSSSTTTRAPTCSLAISEIAEDADGADAVRRGHRLGDRGQRRPLAIFRWAVFAHAVDRDIGAQAREPFGEGAAKPAAGSGDQRNLAVDRRRGVA